MNKDKIQNHLKELFEYYCTYDNSIRDNNIKIYTRIVESIYEAILKFDLTESEIEQVEKSKQYLDNQTGHILCPNKNRDNFVILINENRYDKESLYIQTLFHELTHVIDYYRFVQKYCDGNYDEIDMQSEQSIFLYWTEYNAKKVGYKLYMQYMFENCEFGINDCKIAEYMKTIELEKENNNIIQNLRYYNNDLFMQKYFVMHYLAIYSVWEDVDKKYFENGSKFPFGLVFACNGKIYNLYNLIKRINSFEIFIFEKENLEKRLNDITN